MKTKKRYLFIVTAVISLFLSGCGNAVYELTEDEEKIIVQSAAYFVAKHNIQQKDGVSGLYVTDEMLAPESESQVETESENETTTQAPEGAGTGNGEEITEQKGISLATAIGHGSELKITYTGSYLTDTYTEGVAYSLDAPAGSTYYIMKFNVANTSDKEVQINNVIKSPVFTLKSGDMKVKAEVTFLSVDLSTYVGDIPVGGNVEMILLFEVPTSKAEGISSPSLQIKIDNKTEDVKL